jgi:hypothetical protein
MVGMTTAQNVTGTNTAGQIEFREVTCRPQANVELGIEAFLQAISLHLIGVDPGARCHRCGFGSPAFARNPGGFIR